MLEWWVVDRHGNRYGPMSDEDARDYVTLWDRDTPDDAPHHVETPRKVRAKKSKRVRPGDTEGQQMCDHPQLQHLLDYEHTPE